MGTSLFLGVLCVFSLALAIQGSEEIDRAEPPQDAGADPESNQSVWQDSLHELANITKEQDHWLKEKLDHMYHNLKEQIKRGGGESVPNKHEVDRIEANLKIVLREGGGGLMLEKGKEGGLLNKEINLSGGKADIEVGQDLTREWQELQASVKDWKESITSLVQDLQAQLNNTNKELRMSQERVNSTLAELVLAQGELTATKDLLNDTQAQLQSMEDVQKKALADLDKKSGKVQAAFSAHYGDGFGQTFNVGSGGTLKFSTVVTNVGDGYDPLTGLFTAPVDGVYAFFGSLRSTNNHGWISLGIYKTKEQILLYTADGSGDPWDRGTGLVTTHLKQGEEVYVRQAGGSTFLEPSGLTTFSGMLLTAD